MITLERIDQIVAARGGQPAIISGSETTSWREFSSRVRAFVDTLIGLQGPGKIQTVCAISHNRPGLLVAAAAAATLRMTYCGLDYSLDSDTLALLIREIDADCLVVSSKFLANRGIDVQRVAEGLHLLDLDGRLHSSGAPSRRQAPRHERQVVTSVRPSRLLSFTSGTSGRPKAIVRLGSFDARRFDYFTIRYGFSAEDRHLLTLPLYHAAGNGWARLFHSLGATIVMAPSEDPGAMLGLIRSEWITTTSITAANVGSMLRHVAEGGGAAIPNRLRFMLVGGKHFPAPVKHEALKVFGPAVYEYYGTTETGVNTIAEPADLMAHPSSVGRPYDGNRIVILDRERRVLAPGQIGTVAINSYMNMHGYIGAAPDVAVIEGEEYILTCETGRLDGEGRLYLASRFQEADPLDVYALETLVRRLGGLHDATLVPVAGEGAVDCAVVPRRWDGTSIDGMEADVRALLKREGVTMRRFTALPAISYSPTGKVRLSELKHELGKPRAQIRSGAESRVQVGSDLRT